MYKYNITFATCMANVMSLQAEKRKLSWNLKINANYYEIKGRKNYPEILSKI